MPRPRGRVRPPNLSHLIKLSHLRHGQQLKLLPRAAPATLDCRNLGLVGPIKDQSQCGSCWDFSGTCVVEGALYKAGVLLPNGSQALSEQYTLDCGQNGGCNGDDNTNVLAWAKETGLPLDSDYGSYKSTPGQCNWNPGMSLFKITDWGFADGSGGEGVTSVSDIKAAMMAYGPIGCAIAADDAFEAWGENSPTFDNPFKNSGATDIDHDVVLVGWDDPGGYWILRNSWGGSWGVGGYIAIVYGSNLVGTESVFAKA